jgi:5-methylcytosine-specific restriction endonuclease McrA
MLDSQLTPQLKKQVTARAKACCEYCRSQEGFSSQSFSVEHIIPRVAGGKTSLLNLALACQGCNNHKYTKIEVFDGVSGERVSLFHPRQHVWSDHFAWTEDFSLMVGLTPTGRATIEAMKLNRKGVVNLRKVLQFVGKHPPK